MRSLFQNVVDCFILFSHIPTAVFEKGLEGNLSEAGDYLKLWTAYCDYLRRQVPSIPTPVTSVEGVTDVEGVETADKSLVELRKTFKRARDSLDACEDTSRCGLCKKKSVLDTSYFSLMCMQCTCTCQCHNAYWSLTSVIMLTGVSLVS